MQIQLNRHLNSRVESVVFIVFVSVVGGDKAINMAMMGEFM